MVLETSYNGHQIAIAGTRITKVMDHLENQVAVIIHRDLTGDARDIELESLETWGVVEFLIRKAIIITIR